LGLSHVATATGRLDPEDKLRLYVQSDKGRVHATVFLSAFGVLCLALSTRSERANAFSRWFIAQSYPARAVAAPELLEGDSAGTPLALTAAASSVALSAPVQGQVLHPVLDERFHNLEKGLTLLADLLGTRLRNVDHVVTTSMASVVSKVTTGVDHIEGLVSSWDDKLRQDIYVARDEARALAAE
jgi:hypothetical protein